ncbi:PREDICTED: protein-cysteine N-palmitoyltransferase HHAT-like, partial [Galeopterus variegatus]|uniref:Protein-cysteine N-palmitoyltransferase HHAT-like n=1 Tax=Galeopterus variegatus TaxID=482537 RepID=A0ABM0SDX7_GALVR
HRPWILMVYGMWACWCVLGTPGVAVVFLHTIISFCVAQFRSLFLSWLCSLLLLSTLRLQGVEEVKRRWYKTESEYYLLQFTLTVRCLCYTSFSLEFCWQQLPAARGPYAFPWMLAYVFYYPVFHNGPILSFPEFITQMQQQDDLSLEPRLCVLARGVGRLLCWWGLAELMVHLLYMHAIYSSIPLLEAVSCWTL